MERGNALLAARPGPLAWLRAGNQPHEPMAFSFIHTGDLHLDSPLTRLCASDVPRAAEVASAARRALADLVDEAIRRQVDAVFIAGDLWDGDWSDVGAGFFVQEQAGRLAACGIRAFAVLGNHDAASRVTDRIREVDALHLFPADAPASIACGPAVIHGMSYPRPDVAENIASRYPPAVPGRINIALLHTSLDGSLGHGRYAPCTVRDLLPRQYHYWALAHVHTRQVVHAAPAREGGTVAYCGVLQGRHVGETGTKGAWYGHIDGEEVRLSPIDLPHVAWYAPEAQVGAAGEDEAMRAALAQVAAEHKGALAVVRLTLTGRSARHFALRSSRRALVEKARFLASGLAGDRLTVEDVRVRTSPPEASVPPLPAGFDALLAQAVRSPQVAAQGAAEVDEVLNALTGGMRERLLETLPELRAYDSARDLSALLEEAARAVAARLELDGED